MERAIPTRHGYRSPNDTTAFDRAHLVEVVDVRQDVLEVSHLTSAPQVIRAWPTSHRVDGDTCPSIDYLGGPPVVRLISDLEQLCGDPRTAELILLAKFTPRARANDRDAGVMRPCMRGLCAVVAQRSGVDCRRAVGLGDESCTGSREEDHRTVNVGAQLQRGRAVVQIEAVGHVAAELADEQGFDQLACDRDCSLDSRYRKAFTSERYRRCDRRRRPDDIDRDDGALVSMRARAFSKAVDDDCSESTPSFQRCGMRPERSARAQVRHPERIRVQPAPEDLDPEQLLQANIAEPNAWPEVLEEGKLTGLGRSLEGHDVEPERLGEPVDVVEVERTAGVERTNAARALPCFQHELLGAGVEPRASELDRRSEGIVGERALVLFPQLELHGEASRSRERHDLRKESSQAW